MYQVGKKKSPAGASTPKIGVVIKEVTVLPLDEKIAKQIGLK